MTDVPALAALVTDELKNASAGVKQTEAEALTDAIAAARRIVLHGVGREGLMMRAFAMRLFHLGLDAHVLGGMTTPPVGKGDLLLVSAGPGYFSTVAALIGIAASAGATTACISAQPEGAVPEACDYMLEIPAQTMADDQSPNASPILPMGSLYEGAQFVVFEILVLMLRDRLNVTRDAMRRRHTNLE